MRPLAHLTAGRRLLPAGGLAALLAAVPALAAGDFDGVWSGGLLIREGRCPSAGLVALIADDMFSGAARFSRANSIPIRGEIAADGSFRGEAGGLELVGRFVGGGFSGSVEGSGCRWEALLTRNPQR